MDITKCSGNDCPLKETCFRYTAPSDMYQSYFTEIPFKDGKCDVYWGVQSQAIYDQLKEVFGD